MKTLQLNHLEEISPEKLKYSCFLQEQPEA